MLHLEGTIRANKAAIVREHEQAVRDGNYRLSDRIVRANPDLFTAMLCDVCNGVGCRYCNETGYEDGGEG